MFKLSNPYLYVKVVDEGDDRHAIEDEPIQPRSKLPSWTIPKINKPSKPLCSLSWCSLSWCSSSCCKSMSWHRQICTNMCDWWRDRTTHITCVCCAKRQMETIDPVIQVRHLASLDQETLSQFMVEMKSKSPPRRMLDVPVSAAIKLQTRKKIS